MIEIKSSLVIKRGTWPGKRKSARIWHAGVLIERCWPNIPYNIGPRAWLRFLWQEAQECATELTLSCLKSQNPSFRRAHFIEREHPDISGPKPISLSTKPVHCDERGLMKPPLSEARCPLTAAMAASSITAE